MARVRLFILSLLVVLAVPLTAGVASAAPANSTGATASRVHTDGADVVYQITFSSPDDVFNFDVDLAAGFTGTTLFAGTRDCCLIGDSWGVEISSGSFPFTGAKCGTGSTSVFTGIAHLGSPIRPLTTSANVAVSYCGGTDVFPAGMEVRFHYNGDGFTVTPTA